MNHRNVETLAIGAGPANLALAVAMEELAPEASALGTLLVDTHHEVAWQRGMLLPWTQSQVSFLKDLVTLRNPTSKFSFVNYLHSVGRLDDFINLGTFTPYRLEISRYLQWVADALTLVSVEHGRTALSVDPVQEDGEVTGWLVHFADGGTIRCRDLVFGAGRDPRIPEEFGGVSSERLIHSTRFTEQLGRLDRDADLRIVVVGGAQSAAEMLWASHQALPRARCTMLMRSIGLNNYESSKFTNELFYPSFIDEFNRALPEARAQLLQEMRRTNYAGLSPDLLESLYREMYLEGLTGRRRLDMITMTEVAESRMDGDEVVLTLVDRRSRRSRELRCDMVLLGTGFDTRMPALVRRLAASVGVEDITVSRHYRMELPSHITARCYLQGVNEATHGIADSLLSVLAARSGEIVTDLLSGPRPEPVHAAGLLATMSPQI
ncbi:SidA/IucD/PvdA family monooxygenase [Streptacidiphilus griseoplanus]|uniref:SidA/IucD/PvdA family monooxygenase n=1 Tax=Peterkaempfera griseoplana TaxID=66896 RepID=UPI0006E39431|nr:SidA/IucD/PvdA family monooxygenase [Peterkaempfera griseoplana]